MKVHSYDIMIPSLPVTRLVELGLEFGMEKDDWLIIIVEAYRLIILLKTLFHNAQKVFGFRFDHVVHVPPNNATVRSPKKPQIY